MTKWIHRIGTCLVLSLLFAVPAVAEESDRLDVVYQDEHEGLAADVALLADETGLRRGQVARAMAFQKSFAQYADDLLARYPDQIAAIWTAPVPRRRGFVRFVGEVPAAEVAPKHVVLRGGGELSLDESYRRAEIAAEALTDAGYENFETYFSPAKQKVHVHFQVPEKALGPNETEVRELVRARIWQDHGLFGKALVVGDRDLEMTVTHRDGPLFTFEYAVGGLWVRDDGVRKCTSGWSVWGNYGYGIVTAAHCTGINQIEEPGGPVHTTYFHRQHRGAKGDVEYHTTNGTEVAEFWASASSYRPVNSVRSTNTMVGNSVCVYGRSSNVRGCNHTVEAVNVTVNIGGVSTGSMARASGDSTIGGDSGGGWSWNNEAWGVHSGSNGSKSWFTPAQQAQSAISVSILTK